MHTVEISVAAGVVLISFLQLELFEVAAPSAFYLCVNPFCLLLPKVVGLSLYK